MRRSPKDLPACPAGHECGRANTAQMSLFERRSLVTPPSAGAAFGRIHDGATIRRDDVSTVAPSALLHEDHKAHKATQRRPCESLRRTATAGGAALRAVAGARTGRITSSPAKNRLLVIRPALAPANTGRRPASPPAGKPLIFSPDFVAFCELCGLCVYAPKAQTVERRVVVSPPRRSSAQRNRGHDRSVTAKGARRDSTRALAQPVAAHDLEQAGMIRKAKRLRRARHVPVVLLERAQHDLPLCLRLQSLERPGRG